MRSMGRSRERRLQPSTPRSCPAFCPGGRRWSRMALPGNARASLAEDWFCDGLLEARCCLDGKRTGDLLRILEDVEVSDLAPAQGNHVNGVLEIPAVVQKCRSAIPLHEYHCAPWRAFHPDVLGL